MNPNQQAQIDAEIDTLAESYKDLQDAKQKFKESQDAIKVQRELPNDKSILVPLTSSMYVPGHISNTQEYLIDIGTQYLVEKDADGAIDYFERKMKFIDVQLAKFSQLLQARLQAKRTEP
uniref:Prefoldin subunit 5 n=1 Tax=Aceria tosichella TaxID=561515 RepID=A0A6G1SKP0_9ACAR